MNAGTPQREAMLRERMAALMAERGVSDPAFVEAFVQSSRPYYASQSRQEQATQATLDFEE